VNLSPPRTLPLFDPAELPAAARPAGARLPPPGQGGGRRARRPDPPDRPGDAAATAPGALLALPTAVPTAVPVPVPVPVPVMAPPADPALASALVPALDASPGPSSPDPWLPWPAVAPDLASDLAPGALLAAHPALWRASQVGGAATRCTATGFDALDAQLPGGGWPHGVLTELLLAQPGIGELRLLAPALAALSPPDEAVAAATEAGAAAARRGPGVARRADADAPGWRCVMLFDPPAVPSAWALQQQGLASRHWLLVRPRAGSAAAASAGHAAPRGGHRLAPLLPAADLLWALEQALRSGHVGAVLAWLPRGLRADALRRLQLAAQAHDGPVFVLRDAQAAPQPSAAPLRLLLQPAGADALTLRLLKRRGPPLAQPLRLALPPVLTPGQQALALTQDLARPPGLRGPRRLRPGLAVG